MVFIAVYYFIVILLATLDTENQVADGLTKALDKIKFERFRKAIGLEPV
jgi:hypothetical protein